MARIMCKCGEVLSNFEAPNDIQLTVYNDFEWDEIMSNDTIEILNIPRPKYDVWRCTKCERIYVFRRGEEKAVKTYVLEENN